MLIQAIRANINAFRLSALREHQNQQQADEITNLKEECEKLKERLDALEEKHKAGDPHATASSKKSAM